MGQRIMQLLAVIGLVCVVGAAYVYVRSDAWFASLPRELLDAELVLRSEGTTFTFTVERPGPATLSVEMPSDCTQDGVLTISPLFVAMRPEPVFVSGREPEHRMTLPHAGLDAVEITFARAGAYVLFVEPIPMAMGNEANPPRARVRITMSRDQP